MITLAAGYVWIAIIVWIVLMRRDPGDYFRTDSDAFENTVGSAGYLGLGLLWGVILVAGVTLASFAVVAWLAMHVVRIGK